jgi:hypothetical protein
LGFNTELGVTKSHVTVRCVLFGRLWPSAPLLSPRVAVGACKFHWVRLTPFASTGTVVPLFRQARYHHSGGGFVAACCCNHIWTSSGCQGSRYEQQSAATSAAHRRGGVQPHQQRIKNLGRGGVVATVCPSVPHHCRTCCHHACTAASCFVARPVLLCLARCSGTTAV